jgi:V-type H+-transporting ATPase subunit e
MSNSNAIAYGTFAYVLVFFAIGVPVSLYARNQTKDESQKKDNFFLAWVFSLIGAFCMWLMWLCCYMHQMNPLVTPDV